MWGKEAEEPVTDPVVGGTGLKTGMYYLRTKAAADAIKFTVDKVGGRLLAICRDTMCRPECVACWTSMLSRLIAVPS
jgi:hypothetical protein